MNFTNIDKKEANHRRGVIYFHLCMIQKQTKPHTHMYVCMLVGKGMYVVKLK